MRGEPVGDIFVGVFVRGFAKRDGVNEVRMREVEGHDEKRVYRKEERKRRYEKADMKRRWM